MREELLEKFIRDFPVLTARDLWCPRCSKLMRLEYQTHFSVNMDARHPRAVVSCHGRSHSFAPPVNGVMPAAKVVAEIIRQAFFPEEFEP